MDRKSIIILVVCFGLFVAMNSLVPKLFPPIDRPIAPTNAVETLSTNTNGTAITTGAPPPVISAAPETAPSLVMPKDVDEQLLVITNENARYIFTSHGGGLKEVELVKYPETVSRKRGQTETNRYATLNANAPVPVLTVLGPELQDDGVFKLSSKGNVVRAEKTLSNGIVLVKVFRPTTNYLIETTLVMENSSAQPIALPSHEVVVGTATPMNAQDNGQVVGVQWFDGKDLNTVNVSHFSSRNVMCMPRTPPSEYRAGETNVVWVSVHNQFFTMVAMPSEPAPEVVTRTNLLPQFEDSRASTRPIGFQTALVYPSAQLAPEQKLEHRLFLFAGPKEYQTLARIGNRFNNEADKAMAFGWFSFVSKPLLLGMNWLHHTLNVGYGWAIIIITIIIKLIFWPLTAASTRSMKRMQALQPQMKAIAEKYKDDPLKRNQKTMEFMRQHKVSPLGGCLPMLIQIPVFIGFYGMIQSAIELRGASFLWVGDLSKPDTLFVIPGFNFPFNLLPLLMGATMLWQARMTPAAPGADPMQQKIMKYMPLIFLVFLYNFSAGLTLYWTVQNLLTILQMKLTKAQPETPAAPTKAVGKTK